MTQEKSKPVEINTLTEIKDLYEAIKNVDLKNTLHGEGMSEDDQKFAQIRVGMIMINAINTLMNSAYQMAQFVKMILPDSADKTKIILSRLEDIDPNKIDDLSTSFIEQLFTIDGEPVRVTIPESNLGTDDVEFKRVAIRQIKIFDEQAAVVEEYIKDIKKTLNENISPEVLKLLSNPVELDDFVVGYFEDKAKDQNITEEERKEYELKLQAKNDGKTLKPIIDDINEQIKLKGNARSIREGFYRNNERVLAAAINIAKQNGFSFPFQMLSDIDEKLIPEKKFNKKYRNIIVYLFARYIKYKADKVTEIDKIFITSAVSNLIILSRPGAIEKYPELAKTMGAALEECATLIQK